MNAKNKKLLAIVGVAAVLLIVVVGINALSAAVAKSIVKRRG